MKAGPKQRTKAYIFKQEICLLDHHTFCRIDSDMKWRSCARYCTHQYQSSVFGIDQVQAKANYPDVADSL